jgi:iron complex outermembrane receptor protein
MIKKIGLFNFVTRLFNHARKKLVIDEGRKPVLNRLLVAKILLLGVVTAYNVNAVDSKEKETYTFSIPQLQVVHSLNQVAEQANITLIFPFKAVESKTANAIEGEYTVQEALGLLLLGTGYEVAVRSNGHISIVLANTHSEEIEDMHKLNKISAAVLKSTAIISIAATSTFVTTANAQDVESDEYEQIVVTGIRSSLQESLFLKKNSSQIVDAISAEDVGKFPDANIADALQRITGVAIDRSGGEGQFITVRGLGPEFNTVLINGRTMATDNNGREFSFDTLSSDIISRSEVYKTPIAGLQEGGIGATVNIITARPLRLDGTNFDATIAMNYAELTGDSKPEVSGVFSHTNEDNTFGVVLGASTSERSSQVDSAQIGGWIFGSQNSILGDESSTALTNADQAPLADIHTPRNLVFSRDFAERERTSLNFTVQAAPTDNVVVTLDALYSEFNVNSVRNLITPFFSQPFIGIETNENNTVTGFNRPGQNFLGGNPDLNISLAQNDNVVSGEDRQSESSQFGLNLQWQISDSFSVNADISRSEAQRRELRPFIVIGTQATTAPRFDLNPENDIPAISNQGVLTDASELRFHFNDVRKRALDDEISEYRLEGNWEFDEGTLEKISFGTLFSNRQKVLIDRRNDGPVRCAYCGYNFAVDGGVNVTPITFGDFLPGASGISNSPVGFTYDPFDVIEYLGRPEQLANRNRQPGLSDEAFQANLASLLELGPDLFSNPAIQRGSSFDVEEEVTSYFVNFELGGDMGDIPWSANIGGRYSSTDVVSVGQQQEILSVRQATGIDALIFDRGPLTDIRVSSSYNYFLPSINVKFDLTEEQMLRFAVSDTVTRPTLSSLGTNNSFSGNVTSALSGGGNPELEPFESTNYDASYEWYYSEVSFFGATVFYKEFTNFLESQTLLIPGEYIDNQDVVRPINFNDTRIRNGEEGSITGTEISIQHAFDSGVLNGFGGSANYTYVTSDVKRAEGSGATDCDYNGLSPNVVNVAGFFENDRFQVRLAYNWRDEFLNNCFDSQSRPRNTKAYGQLDFSASYNINERFQIFASGVNILDERLEQFSVLEERFLQYEHTDARYTIGVRGSF